MYITYTTLKHIKVSHELTIDIDFVTGLAMSGSKFMLFGLIDGQAVTNEHFNARPTKKQIRKFIQECYKEGVA